MTSPKSTTRDPRYHTRTDAEAKAQNLADEADYYASETTIEPYSDRVTVHVKVLSGRPNDHVLKLVRRQDNHNPDDSTLYRHGGYVFHSFVFERLPHRVRDRDEDED